MALFIPSDGFCSDLVNWIPVEARQVDFHYERLGRMYMPRLKLNE